MAGTRTKLRSRTASKRLPLRHSCSVDRRYRTAVGIVRQLFASEPVGQALAYDALARVAVSVARLTLIAVVEGERPFYFNVFR